MVFEFTTSICIMDYAALNILNWIDDFNNKVCSHSIGYQITPITLRSDATLNCIGLSEILSGYIQFLIKDFIKGCDEQYSSSERILLPCITKMFPEIEEIAIDNNNILKLSDLGGLETIVGNLVLSKIVEFLCPAISSNNDIQRFGIEVFNVDGGVFADVCYALTSVNNVEEFKLWVKGISNPCTMTANFTVNCLDKLECKILFNGEVSDLYKIPRSVTVNMTEYLFGWCDEIVGEREKEVTLSVRVLDDNLIVLSYPKTQLYRDYFDEILTSRNRLNINIQGYELVDGGLYEKAKELLNKRIKCDFSGYEGYFISELIEGTRVYEMAIEEDSKTWDGCIGSVVMVKVPQEELTRNTDAVSLTGGFLIKMDK